MNRGVGGARPVAKPGLETRQVLDRLYQSRKRAGMTQEFVADTLDISVHSYCRLELGGRSLHVDMLFQLAQLYEVSVVWLLTGKRV